MKIYPQRVLKALAATGFIALGTTAVVAQNDQTGDNQRDRRESSEWGEIQSADGVQERVRDNQRQGDRNFQRNQSENRIGSTEPWESRASDVQQDDGERPGLGVSFETKNGRAVISQVHPGSPAEEMGLRRGDRITQVNGKEVSTARDVIEVVRQSDPGDDIEIEVTRDGDDRSFEGELETRRQALVLRGNRGERTRLRSSSETNWNSDRNERRSYSMRGDTNESDRRRGEFSQSGRGQQDVHRQLDSLQRQVQQINREIAQLRRSIDGQTGSYGQNETQAGYSEYGDERGNETRTSYSSEDQQAPDEEFRSQAYRGGDRGQEADQENSPGGVVGGARTRPESDWIDNR